MTFLPGLLILSLITHSFSSPLSPLIVREQIPSAPLGFVDNGPAPASSLLNLRVSLVSNNLPGLENALYAAANPGSPSYGKYLSAQQVQTFVSPTTDSLNAFNSFLNSNKITAQPMSAAKDWWNMTLSVEKANSLFGAQYSTFTEQNSGKQAIRTLSYSIPASLKGHINVIHPTVNFPQLNSKGEIGLSAPRVQTKFGQLNSSASTAPAIPCSEGLTPPCLQSLYGIPSTPAPSVPNNAIAVSGFVDQFAQDQDLELYLANFVPNINPNTSFQTQVLDGGANTQGPNDGGIEANLDIQYTVGMANNVPTIFVSVGDDFQDDDLAGSLDLIQFVGQMDPLPTVLTTSYGRDEDTITSDLAIELCNAILQLTARGTSVLFASGDGGVSGGQSQDCTQFIPTFPAGCPYVTSVGATATTNGVGPETAATLSSGGFSNIFPIPSYQTNAVKNYLSTLGETNSGLFNASGRGFPDVSAVGQSIVIVDNAEAELVDGTSCASPIFASVIALVNAQRMSSGKGPLGFLNPLLYNTSDILNDITSGSNPGCGTDGFPASIGWDPVTGLGTPNFNSLIGLP
ncbi:hypothetical protein M422DRAFT_266848 [Sphaerobolus stellatus SS14]|uniref:tripeptidyl-peptidase II n=1 Tax=Sphaerobolus stellatus (strain SS14) TaxID=990650 RepID=A0A0C9V1Y0_SPHS4|nr:hypothetical protein M422DRAFT_266848 [Sphaerobolus stellatus SS14]